MAQRIDRRRRSLDAGRWLSILLLLLLCQPAVADSPVEQDKGLLTLVGGDRCRGELIRSDLSETLRWHLGVLETPVDFRIDRIESIRFDRPQPKSGSDDGVSPNKWVVELVSGDLIVASLTDWTGERLKLASEAFGAVSVDVAIIRRLHHGSLPKKAASTSIDDKADKDDSTSTLRVQTTAGAEVTGKFQQFDLQTRQIVIATSDGQRKLSLDEIARVDWRQTTQSTDPQQAALFLLDGSRISGELLSVDAQAWSIAADHFDQPIQIPRAHVRLLRMFRNSLPESEPPVGPGRLGRLVVDGNRLSGRLVESQTKQAETSPLVWQPDAATGAGPIRLNVPAKIVYRERTTRHPDSVEARAAAMQQRRLQQQRRGLNFGELFLQRVDRVSDDQPTRDAHLIHARTGDVVACRVEAIDDRGVTISTVHSDRRQIAHARIKAVEFTAHSPPPDLQEAKRQRLLTLPRLQQNNPPTHLLCSHNGDFLRCRLIELQDGVLRVELPTQTAQVPRERVAQIIWFHPQSQTASLPEGGQAAGEQMSSTASFRDQLDGKVQILQRDDKRVTFVPTAVTSNELQGESDLVGPVRVGWNSIDELIIGPQIANAVSDMAYQQWALQR